MGTIYFQNRIDQALSSMGDGTGVTDANVAGQSITGSTTADPTVVTVATHGRSVGEWVFIDGATGTTEINGIRQILTAPNANTFTLADEAGDAVGSAGTFGGTVDMNLAFVIKPPAADDYVIVRLNGMAADASLSSLDGLLGVARISNGIFVKAYDGAAAALKQLNPLAIKGWNDWSLCTGGGDSPLQDIANTKLESSMRWTFTRNGEGGGGDSAIRLKGANGDFLILYSQDDLDGLSALRFAVQGYIEA